MQENIEDKIIEQGEFMGQSYVVCNTVDHDQVKKLVLSYDESIEYVDTTELDNNQTKIWFV